jgi:hypothetical protein
MDNYQLLPNKAGSEEESREVRSGLEKSEDEPHSPKTKYYRTHM